MKKPSFFERLSGTVGDENYGEVFEDEHEAVPPVAQRENTPMQGVSMAPHRDQTTSGYRSLRPNVPPAHSPKHAQDPRQAADWEEQDTEVGELAVDVYQTPEHVVVKALVAGVVPANLDITVARETLTIRGTREDEKEVDDENYFQQELYWGPFARTILLPEEIDVDQAEAIEKHGILMIRLPKINKARQTKLRVRSK